MNRLLLPSLLFASLGLNLVLLVFRLAAPEVPSGEGASLPECRRDLARLERRIRTAEGAAGPWLSPPMRFDRTAAGTPCPAEARVRPALDRILEGTPHTLECRGRVCRLKVRPAEDDPGGWQVALLSDAALSGLLEGLEVRSAPTDPGAREAFLVLGDPRARSGEARLAAVIEAFRGSEALAGCAAAHPEVGDLTVELTAGGDGRLGTWVLGGSLTHTAGGACVQDALEVFLADRAGGGPSSFARRTETFTLGPGGSEGGATAQGP